MLMQIMLIKKLYLIIVLHSLTVANTAATDADANNANKKAILNNCALFIICISKIINTHVDNAKDSDVVMTMYNLIKYSDNYSKASGSLWQNYKDIPDVDDNGI